MAHQQRSSAGCETRSRQRDDDPLSGAPTEATAPHDGAVWLIYAGAGIRALTVGLTGVLLGLYLAQLGSGAGWLGLIVGLGLAGNAVGTTVVAFAGGRFSQRTGLITASILTAAGAAALALTETPVGLGVAAFLGMVNGMGKDRGPAQTLDQSLLADAGSAESRAALFTRYTFVQDALGGVGTLAAAVPDLLGSGSSLAAYRWTFAAIGVLSLAPAVLYSALPRTRPGGGDLGPPPPIREATRRKVAGLTALFALDSLGGGFLAGSILSYWFFQRFGFSGEVLGPLFFAARVLNALSYFAAQALARRLGLIRTMVFTHLPSSLLLLVLPWTGSPWIAMGAFLLREALVQMDVPTRQAYVAAVTAPGERTFALGVTGLARNVGWAVGPGLAGLAIGALGLGAPLVAGAALKIVYDVALYRSCREEY